SADLYRRLGFVAGGTVCIAEFVPA
ncbi:MAG: hypothetical protein JWM93_1981, partial [Frankiales bacterium]|nr:hypothetical protein [Frankiales bacterium]